MQSIIKLWIQTRKTNLSIAGVHRSYLHGWGTMTIRSFKSHNVPAMAGLTGRYWKPRCPKALFRDISTWTSWRWLDKLEHLRTGKMCSSVYPLEMAAWKNADVDSTSRLYLEFGWVWCIETLTCFALLRWHKHMPATSVYILGFGQARTFFTHQQPAISTPLTAHSNQCFKISFSHIMQITLKSGHLWSYELTWLSLYSLCVGSNTIQHQIITAKLM